MKKTLPLLFVLLCLFVYQASAQIPIGAKAGINWNSFRGNQSFDVVPGFSVGAFGRYKVLSYLTAKAELLYFQQGVNLVDYSVLAGDLYHNDADVIFHTIQLPVLAEFGLPSLSEETLQPKISVGAFYGYTLYARERFVNVATLGGYDAVEYNGKQNATAQYKRSQFGLIGAVGADLTVLNFPVYLEFRYTHNLTRMTKPGMTTRYNLENTFDYWDNEALKVGTLSFNIAVTLHTL
jgi:hypothetical protein